MRWSQLEAQIPLSDLPRFHRDFLVQHRPELQAQTLPLRRVQQYVSQTLLQLAQQGLALRQGDDFVVEAAQIPLAWHGLLGLPAQNP